MKEGGASKQQAVEFPQVLTSLHNNVFAHGTVTNDNHVTIKGLGQINTYSELINTINTFRGTS